jgi:transcriptional regulator with XRE-family HTH domain
MPGAGKLRAGTDKRPYNSGIAEKNQYKRIILWTKNTLFVSMEKIRGLNWAIARAVKELRETGKLTQGQLAGFAGLSEVYLSSLEQGKRGDSITALMHIARALGVDCSELVRRIEGELAGKAQKPRQARGRPRREAARVKGDASPSPAEAV